jgi:hypothetical protein
MKKILMTLLLLASLTGGCAQNYYNVPTEQIASKVKVLGIAPFFIDTNSDIKYPQKDQLVSLIAELNQNNQALLARKLKITGNFNAVTALDGEARQLFSSLLFRHEKRDDATILYNKYFWKNDELRSYIQKNNLDAVMLVTVSGLTKKETMYASNLLTKLEANYNFLTMTAQILDANGVTLWEYPNFRRRLLTYYPLVNLQYADFSESDANLSGKTEVKFKNIDGVRRALEKKDTDWLLREIQEPAAYSRQFNEMVSLIKYDSTNDTTTAPPIEPKPQPTPAMLTKPVEAPPPPAVTPPVIVATPPPVAAPPPAVAATPPPQPDVAPLAAPLAVSDEIVPATGSTR